MKFLMRLFIFFFVLLIFSSLVKNILDYRKKIQFYQDFKQEYENEKKRSITLQTEALKKSSISEVEKTIRNKLNLLKPDEVAILLPSPTPVSTTPPPTAAPNWVRWWKVFFR